MNMRGTLEALLLGNFILFALIFMISVPILVFLYAGYWKLFKKCDEEGWQAIVPIYNTYVLTQISGNHWWWFLIASSSTIVSFTLLRGYVYNFFLLSLFGRFVINYNLSKKFHKDLAYTILMTLFPLIMYAIMGYSSDKFDYKAYVSPNGPFDYSGENIPKEGTIKEEKKVTPSEEVVVNKKESIYTYDETPKEETPKVKKTTTKKATAKKEATKKTTAKKTTTTKKPVKKTTTKKDTKKPIKRSYKRKLEAEAAIKEKAKKPVKKTVTKKTTSKKVTTKRSTNKKK